MRKKLLAIGMMLALTLGAWTQESPAATGDCPLEPLPTLGKKERKELKANLDSYIDMWKTIGPSGDNPKLIFKDMDEKRIVVSVEYTVNDATLEGLQSMYDWIRVEALYNATHRLSDIFDMVARLGMDVVVHAKWSSPQKESTAFCAYDNETLRRIMALESYTSAFIYSDLLTIRKRLPLQMDDSLFLTDASYCNHLYTMHLHSTAADDPTVASQFFWMISNKWFIANNGFMPYVGTDSTTLRIVGSIEGSRDTVTLDYPPAQLLGKEPAIDVNLAGQYIARSVGRECPKQLPDSIGVWTHTSYDPSLRVVVMHYTVDELYILNIEGKENELKYPLLDNLVYADGIDFLSLLAIAEVGLELRWQSRTTGRRFTVTYTTDEITNYLTEE